MWIIILIFVISPLILIGITIYEEYKWAKQDSRLIFHDKFGNWHK